MLEKFQQIGLTNGNIVTCNPDQFFCWSETGMRMELWQENSLLRLVKSWHIKWIHWVRSK